MNDTQLSARSLPTRQDVQVLQSDFDVALNYYTPQIADALPDHIPLPRFKRVLITAIHQDRELYSADRQSLFNACVKCAQDGLYPDGREAVLKVFNTKVKRTNEKGIEYEQSVPLVTYMPMVAGIRKRMRNSGIVLSSVAEVVYRNDKFRHLKGEDARIEHEPAALDADRGDPVGAYAIIKLNNGETLREVMGAHEIEYIRKTFSRGSDGPRSPWTTSRGEMWRKTVLRRCAKSAPMDSDLNRLLEREDELPEIPENVTLPPPRPTREMFERQSVDQDAPSAPDVPLYTLINCDAEPFECTGEMVEEELLAILAQAQKRGDAAIEAALDNNEDIPTKIACPRAAHEITMLRAYLARAKSAKSGVEQPKRYRATKAEMEERRRAQNPKPAEVYDPERKPSEGVDDDPVDEAGGSSETEAGPTSGGGRDGRERPPTSQNPADGPSVRPAAALKAEMEERRRAQQNPETGTPGYLTASEEVETRDAREGERQAGSSVSYVSSESRGSSQPLQNPADGPPARPAAALSGGNTSPNVPPSLDEAASLQPSSAPQGAFIVPMRYERDGQTPAYRAWWLAAFLPSLRAFSKTGAAEQIEMNDEVIQIYFKTISSPSKVAAMAERDAILKELT